MSIQPKHQLKPVLTMCLQTNKVWRPSEAEGSLQWLLSLSQPHLFQWIHWEGCKACNRNTFWSKVSTQQLPSANPITLKHHLAGPRLVPASAALGTHHGCRCDDPTVVCIPQLFSWWKAKIQTTHLMKVPFDVKFPSAGCSNDPGSCDWKLLCLKKWWPYTSTFHSKKLGPNTPELCWPLGLPNVSNEWKKLNNSVRPRASTYHFSYDVDGTNRTKVCWVWPVQKEYFLYSSHLPRQASWILRQQIQIWQVLELSWYVHRN